MEVKIVVRVGKDVVIAAAAAAAQPKGKMLFCWRWLFRLCWLFWLWICVTDIVVQEGNDDVADVDDGARIPSKVEVSFSERT